MIHGKLESRERSFLDFVPAAKQHQQPFRVCPDMHTVQLFNVLCLFKRLCVTVHYMGPFSYLARESLSSSRGRRERYLRRSSIAISLSNCP